jgi:Outer membrane protein beta-barrel domain
VNKKIIALAAVATLALSTAAHAQDGWNSADGKRGSGDHVWSNFYAGGFGGYSWTDAEVAGPDLDVNGGDYGVFVGYEVTGFPDRTWGLALNGALELHYAWSGADDNIAGVDIEKDSEWGVTFRPGLAFISDRLPLNLKPYGIIGYRRAEFDATGAGFSGSETFNGLDLGIGTELVSYGDYGIRLDYSHVFYEQKGGIDPSENDLRLGVAYHF